MPLITYAFQNLLSCPFRSVLRPLKATSVLRFYLTSLAFFKTSGFAESVTNFWHKLLVECTPLPIARGWSSSTSPLTVASLYGHKATH